MDQRTHRPGTAAVLAGGALLLLASWLVALPPPAAADLVGHGGPVRTVAAAPGGRRLAVSGGFDHSVMVWDTATEALLSRLLAHEGTVNGVRLTADGLTAVSVGDDGLLAVWDLAARTLRSSVRTDARLTAVAISPDDATAAVAGWDGSVRLIGLADGAERGRASLGAAGERATAVAFTPDGGVVAAGHLGTVKVWDAGLRPLRDWRAQGLGVTGLARAGGRAATASVDRTVQVWDVATGRREMELPGHERPLSAIAISRDGAWVASGAVDGQLVLWSTAGDGAARLVRRAHAGPVWDLAFRDDGTEILSAGNDGVVRRWSVPGGERLGRAAEPAAVLAAAVPPGHARGAAAFRKCAACHTLTPDGGNRAGPTFHGLFGRRAGSVPGYAYSPALKESGIVWTEETVAKLFELGPDAFTPGSKMPMQQITDPADRAALVAYLREVTASP